MTYEETYNEKFGKEKIKKGMMKKFNLSETEYDLVYMTCLLSYACYINECFIRHVLEDVPISDMENETFSYDFLRSSISTAQTQIEFFIEGYRQGRQDCFNEDIQAEIDELAGNDL